MGALNRSSIDNFNALNFILRKSNQESILSFYVKLDELISIIVIVVIISKEVADCDDAITGENFNSFPKINIRVWYFHLFHLPENGTA